MSNKSSSPTKTKVLYVVESFSTGVYAIVRDIACNLDPKRFEVLILHSLRGDSPKEFKDDFDVPHVTLSYLPMGSLKEYLPAVRKIKREIAEFNPDCIHLHSSKAGFLGRLAARSFRKKNILYSPHGLSYLRTDVGNLKRSLFFLLEFWINKYVPSKIIAVSEGEKEHALRITKNVMVINNFIDVDAIKVTEDPQGSDFVTTGRVAPQKNPHLFNEIAKALSSHTFTWVGDGPLTSQLTQNNIRVTGYVSRSEAVSTVEQAKVYLQTSLWEGMPVSILEAMAAAKAVVASNIVGNRDLITHQKTGILCDVENKEEFISALSLLISNSKKRDKLGQAARSYVEKYHSIKAAVNSYEKEYLPI